MLRGALVGFGAVAANAHAPAWNARGDARIEAVAEADAERREKAGKSFDAARVYATLEELLASLPRGPNRPRGTRREENGRAARRELDFAVLTTPPHLHARQARACLAAGLHVLCEKPLAFTGAEAAALAKAARKARRALLCVHNWKHAPILSRLAELLAEGAIGPVRHAEWHVLRTRPSVTADADNWRRDLKRSGGGILVDHGWHALYLLVWLLGQTPERARATLKRAPRSRAEEEATVLLEFPAATAVVHLSWGSPVRDHWGRFYGPAGSIELRDDGLLLRRLAQPPQEFTFPEKLSAGSAHPDWLRGTLIEFLDAVRDPRKAAANLREAEACARTIEQIYREAK